MSKMTLNAQRESALVQGEPGHCRFLCSNGCRCSTETNVLFIGGKRNDGKPRTRWHICRDHAAPLVGLPAHR